MLSDSGTVACQRRAGWLQFSISDCSAFATHVELCGMRFVGKALGLGSSATHFLGAGRMKGPEDGDGD